MTAGLTGMSPGRPVVRAPADVSAPVIGVEPSRNSGSCALPLPSDVTVEVADNELRTLLVAPALSTCSVVPVGLENCRLVPNAALSCAATEAAPPEKSTP